MDLADQLRDMSAYHAFAILLQKRIDGVEDRVSVLSGEHHRLKHLVTQQESARLQLQSPSPRRDLGWLAKAVVYVLVPVTVLSVGMGSRKGRR